MISRSAMHPPALVAAATCGIAAIVSVHAVPLSSTINREAPQATKTTKNSHGYHHFDAINRIQGLFTDVPQAVASPTASPMPRPTAQIIKGYDFSIFPDLDTPPPINVTWNKMYNVDQEPACPAIDNTGDWGCYNVTRLVDVVACPLHNQWALTYDDGPSPYTPALLDALQTLKLKATFCVIGSRVMSNPSILRRAYDEGHQICSHTWSHHFLTSQTSEQIISEFEWTNKIIEHVTGARPAFARPPFGDMDDRVRQVFTNMGMRPLIWNLDTFDWNLASSTTTFQPQWVVGNFTLWVQNAVFLPNTGFMSLEHDLYAASAAQTIPSLQIVHNAGYNIMPISDCMNIPRYLSVVSVPIPNYIPDYSVLPGNNISLPENPKAINAASKRVSWTSMALLTVMLVFVAYL